MKGDFSRLTFDPARHFSGVRMQQGRVQLDADWNEQADIARHRVETETLHTLGGCGAPLHDAGFAVGEGADGDFRLSAGAYYVHGVLARCEVPVGYRAQPDRPRPPALPAGDHLVYLDVWERHLTALEAPSIRETALGGPDTATRTRTVWQVRTAPLPGGAAECRSAEADQAFADATTAGTGTLRARAQAEERASDPCVIPAGAGYRGLENQLYRVEIHDGGPGVAAPEAKEGVAVTHAEPLLGTVTVEGGDWAVGDAVELWDASSAAADAVPAPASVVVTAHVARVNGKTLHLTTSFPALAGAAGPRLRAVGATWKWSRDNGIVVARVRKVEGADVSLDALGLDDVLDFRAGDWVELTDAARELEGVPGVMAQIKAPNPASRTLTLVTAPDFTVDLDRAPRLRRWDGFAAVRTGGDAAAWMGVEQGIQLAWDGGGLHTGEYWQIPARTATGEQQSGTVEWPREGGLPAARRPAGPVHRYARLGIVRVGADASVTPLADCRCLFTPLTEVNALAYVSGTGQEALPDLTREKELVPVPLPLVVGMANGQCRAGTRVRFRVTGGGGTLSPSGEESGKDAIEVEMDAAGRASAWWWLLWDPAHPVLDQTAEAVLLEDDVEVQLPIAFTASLSVASRVAYDPGKCEGMEGRVTVQAALDHLSSLPRLFPLSGDGQQWMPAEIKARMQPLRVRVASSCGPLSGRRVRFAVQEGEGSVDESPSRADVLTDADGIAEALWIPDGATHRQEVSATLIREEKREVLEHPYSTRFTFTLATADQVAYTPGACGALEGQTTVQSALDRVVALTRLSRLSGDGQEAAAGRTPEPLRVLVSSDCGPAANREKAVRFTVVSGAGTLEGGAAEVTVGTDAEGVAEVSWQPDVATPFQEVEAVLVDDGLPAGTPDRVRFGATVAPVLGGDGGPYSLVLSADDPAWRKRLDMYAGTFQNLDICFRAGRFEFHEPLYIEEKGHVTLTGVGPQSELVCAGAETVVLFAQCDSVRVSSLSVHAGRGERDEKGLNGALQFQDCTEVDVWSCTLRCAGRRRKRASCLAVIGEPRPYHVARPVVRIRDCQAWIGHRQIGFLLRDADVAMVHDNVLRVDDYPGLYPVYEELRILGDERPDHLKSMLNLIEPRPYDPEREWFYPAALPPGLIQSPVKMERTDGPAVTRGRLGGLAERLAEGVRGVRRTLAGGAEEGADGKASAGESVGDEAAGEKATAEAGGPVKPGPEKPLPEREKPLPVETGDPGQEFPYAFLEWYRWLHNVADQGIVVAGTSARDVRVTGNVVDGALRGIHVAVSDDRTLEREMAGSVLVADNEISLRMTHSVRHARHGIFVGNARQVRVHDNRVKVYRAFVHLEEQENVEGIKLFGYYGPHVLVRDNTTFGADVGISVGSLNAASMSRMSRRWVVSGNMAHGRTDVVVREGEPWTLVDNGFWLEEP